MRATGGTAGQLAFVRGFTGYQWLVFFVVWAGWSLDATDFGLFSLVLRPALTELLGGQPTIAEIGRVGGIPLVAEAFAEVHRAKILGVMMTGGAMGSIIGGQVYALIGGFGWRYVFFAGIAPAL